MATCLLSNGITEISFAGPISSNSSSIAISLSTCQKTNSEALAVTALWLLHPVLAAGAESRHHLLLPTLQHWTSLGSWAGLSILLPILASAFNFGDHPPTDIDKMFGPLDGMEIEGTRTHRKFRVHVFKEPDNKQVTVGIVTGSPEVTVGHMKFLYDSDWPLLLGEDVQIGPDYRSEGIYSQILVPLISHLPLLTTFRHRLEEEQIVNVLYTELMKHFTKMDLDAINSEVQWLSLSEKYRALVNYCKLVTNMSPEPLIHSAEARRRIDALLAEQKAHTQRIVLLRDFFRYQFANTPMGHPLVRAGLVPTELMLVANLENLYLNTVVGVDDYLREQGVEPHSVSAVLLKHFIENFTERTQIAPPRELLELAYLYIRTDAVEITELYRFTEDLESSMRQARIEVSADNQKRLMENFRNPTFFTLQMLQFLRTHNFMAELRNPDSTVHLDFTGAPILNWVFHAQEYDEATAMFITQSLAITSLLDEAVVNPAVLRRNWPYFYEVYAQLDRPRRPLFNKSLSAFLNELDSGQSPADIRFLKDVYYRIQRHRVPRSPIKISRPQAYWANLLITSHKFEESQVLGWLVDARDRKVEVREHSRLFLAEIMRKMRQGSLVKSLGQLFVGTALWSLVEEIMNQQLLEFKRDPRMLFRLVGMFTGRGGFSDRGALHEVLYVLVMREELFQPGAHSLVSMNEEQFMAMIKRLPFQTTNEDLDILRWAFELYQRLMREPEAPVPSTSPAPGENPPGQAASLDSSA